MTTTLTRSILEIAERHEPADVVALICPSQRYGTLAILNDDDALARVHNMRVEALRTLEAAAYNEQQGAREIARVQRRSARNILEDVRLLLER